MIAASLALLPACKEEEDFKDSVIKEIPNEPITDVLSDADDTEAALTEETASEAVTAAPEAETDAKEADGEIGVSYGVIDNPQSNTLVDIYVKFPILSGTVNDELVNAILKDSVTAMVDSDTQSLAAGSEKLTYEITDVAPAYLENSFVSFLFEGNYYTAGSAHPTEFVRTLNIDIEKGEAYGLDDICKDTDGLTKLFESGDAFALIPTGNSIADSELSEMSRVGLGYFTSAYFIDENGEAYFAVSIEIPHVLGDHAEYKAKLSDVEQLLDSGIITLTKGNN